MRRRRRVAAQQALQLGACLPDERAVEEYARGEEGEAEEHEEAGGAEVGAGEGIEGAEQEHEREAGARCATRARALPPAAGCRRRRLGRGGARGALVVRAEDREQREGARAVGQLEAAPLRRARNVQPSDHQAAPGDAEQEGGGVEAAEDRLIVSGLREL